jgi:PAS domain S-box-containing protein
MKDLDQNQAAQLAEYIEIFNNLPIGLYRTSLDGKFLKANPECAALLGYDSIDELKASNSKDFYFKDEDREKFLSALKEKVIKNYELPLKNRLGKKIWVAITARLCEDEGYLEGSIMDISDRKRLEEEIDKYRQRETACLADLAQEAKRRLSDISVNGNGNGHVVLANSGLHLQ